MGIELPFKWICNCLICPIVSSPPLCAHFLLKPLQTYTNCEVWPLLNSIPSPSLCFKPNQQLYGSLKANHRAESRDGTVASSQAGLSLETQPSIQLEKDLWIGTGTTSKNTNKYQTRGAFNHSQQQRWKRSEHLRILFFSVMSCYFLISVLYLISSCTSVPLPKMAICHVCLSKYLNHI